MGTKFWGSLFGCCITALFISANWPSIERGIAGNDGSKTVTKGQGVALLINRNESGKCTQNLISCIEGCPLRVECYCNGRKTRTIRFGHDVTSEQVKNPEEFQSIKRVHGDRYEIYKHGRLDHVLTLPSAHAR